MNARISLILMILISNLAWAKPWKATLGFDSADRIQGLEFEDREIDVDKTEASRSVTLAGKYPRAGWTLVAGTAQVKRSKKGEFRLVVPVETDLATLQFRVVGPMGQVERQVVVLRVPGAPTLAGKPNKIVWVPGIGHTTASFWQNGYGQVDMTGITGKVSAIYSFEKSRWDLGSTVYATLLPLSVSKPGVSMRFLGVNIRSGYSLPIVPSPFRLVLRFGVYFTTMGVSGSPLGYYNQLGPQLYPELRYSMKNGKMLSTYFKFAPVADGIGFLSMANYETATGLAYGFPLNHEHMLSGSIDYSHLELRYPLTNVNLSTISFGVGYSL